MKAKRWVPESQQKCRSARKPFLWAVENKRREIEDVPTKVGMWLVLEKQNHMFTGVSKRCAKLYLGVLQKC